MNAIYLTPLEAKILDHRLTVPDAIADYLIDSGAGYAEEDIEHVCGLLLKRRWQEAAAFNRSLWLAVLVDAVEGSTYYGSGVGEASDQYQAAVARAGRSLATKVGKLAGRPVEFPEY